MPWPGFADREEEGWKGAPVDSEDKTTKARLKDQAHFQAEFGLFSCELPRAQSQSRLHLEESRCLMNLWNGATLRRLGGVVCVLAAMTGLSSVAQAGVGGRSHGGHGYSYGRGGHGHGHGHVHGYRYGNGYGHGNIHRRGYWGGYPSYYRRPYYRPPVVYPRVFIPVPSRTWPRVGGWY